MIGNEILKQIKERRTADHQFIKWWRKEEDFLDYDRLDSFIENIDLGEDIGGFDRIDSFIENIDLGEEIGEFDLFTMEEMWENLEKVTSSRVERTKKKGEDVIVWRRGSGEEQVCPYNAESMMTIFDVETHGDYID